MRVARWADRAAHAAQAAADELGGRDVARAVRCDVVDAGEVDALLAAAVDEFWSLDVLVNNAGITRDATMRTMTHLHGGVGVDITYPLHRYFSIAKDLARLAGGATQRLDELADVRDLATHESDDTAEDAADVH